MRFVIAGIFGARLERYLGGSDFGHVFQRVSGHVSQGLWGRLWTLELVRGACGDVFGHALDIFFEHALFSSHVVGDVFGNNFGVAQFLHSGSWSLSGWAALDTPLYTPQWPL